MLRLFITINMIVVRKGRAAVAGIGKSHEGTQVVGGRA